MATPATTDLPSGNRSQLAWRCRRGMKELDLLLSGWLESQFGCSSEAQRRQFEALLGLSDPQLVRYLLGGERPERADLVGMIEAVRAGSGVMSSPPAPAGNLP
jgi:antitoxin CptB